MDTAPKGYYPKRIHRLNQSLVALIAKAGELRLENEKLKAQLKRTRKKLREKT